MTHHYAHYVSITPTADDELVTAWDDTPGVIAEWHAIDDVLVEAGVSKEAGRAADQVFCDDDDLPLLLAVLDRRGWSYEDGGECRVNHYNDGSHYIF